MLLIQKNIGSDGVGSITASTDAAGLVGTVYDEQITVVGGNTPYTYAEGATKDLPAGLTFNATTGKLESVATSAKTTAVLDV